MGGGLGSCKDVLVMVGMQCIYAGLTLFSKAAFDDGLNPQIFIVYRQALATLIIAPLALLSMKKSKSSLCLKWKTFSLVFAAAFFGITAEQSAYFEGVYYSSATIAGALAILTCPATFVLSVIVRAEKVDVLSLRGVAKILGTTISVVGAVAVSLLKGPTLVSVSVELWMRSEPRLTTDSTWLLGCMLVFASSWFWSVWLVLQVPIAKNCPDHLYSTFLTCLFGLVQTTVLAMFMERRLQDWKLDTAMEYVACIFSGVGSAAAVFGQAWCVSRKGPVFSASFNPLCTVIVAIIGSMFLHEDIYLGTLLGSMTIIAGLYMVLWGKANDQLNKDGSTNDLQESLLPPDNTLNLEEDSESQHT